MKSTLSNLGGQSDLSQLYEAVAKNAPQKLAENDSWKEKVRQVLNQNPSMFKPVERGVWAIAA